MSREVLTPLLISAGLIGLPIALGVSGCSRKEEDKRDKDAPPTVTADQDYPNNYFLPGAGYYHSPFHAWFPFPYNNYVSGRGYYRGGSWRSGATPDQSEFTDGFRGGPGSVRSGFSAGDTALAPSRPTPEAVSRANAVTAARFGGSSMSRGGFGHSSRPSFS